MKRKYNNDDFRQINRKFRRKLKYNDLIAMKGKQFNIRFGSNIKWNSIKIVIMHFDYCNIV